MNLDLLPSTFFLTISSLLAHAHSLSFSLSTSFFLLSFPDASLDLEATMTDSLRRRTADQGVITGQECVPFFTNYATAASAPCIYPGVYRRSCDRLLWQDVEAFKDHGGENSIRTQSLAKLRPPSGTQGPFRVPGCPCLKYWGIEYAEDRVTGGHSGAKKQG